MFGQMHSYPPLGAAQHHIAFDQFGVQHSIYPRTPTLHPLELFPPGEQLLAYMPADDLDLRHDFQGRRIRFYLHHFHFLGHLPNLLYQLLS